MLRDEAPSIEVRATPDVCVRIPCRIEFRAYLRGEVHGAEWNCPIAQWEWPDGTSPSIQAPSEPCPFVEPERAWPLLGDMVNGEITDYKAHVFTSPGTHEIWFRLLSTGRQKELARGRVVVSVPRGL